MANQSLTLTAPVAAGGTVTVPAALNNGDTLTAVVHVPTAPWVFGAKENGAFTLPAGSHVVRYGAGATYVTRVMSGAVACNNATFGDPDVGVVKHCDYDPGLAPSPPLSAPVAALGAVMSGLTATCSDKSTGGTPTSWTWAFGDGNGSTQQNPTHIYAAAGTYTITLTVTNSAGSSSATLSVVASAPIVLPWPGLQAAHDAAPAGKTIIIPVGTHTETGPGRFVSTKTGLVWQAAGPGVIFDMSKIVCGQQQAAFELKGPLSTMQGFRLFGGLASRRVGNVVGYCLSGDSQKVIDIESDHFGEMGGSVQQSGTNYLILRGKIHDNNLDLASFAGAQGGNVPPFDPGWEAGGIKIWWTNGIVDGLEGWNNYGPGVWPDTNNHDTIIRNVRYHDSPYTAIMWEVSHNVQILNNVVWECCWNDGYSGGARDFWSTGILVSSAGPAIVRGNLVAWCPAGVIFVSQKRADYVPMTGDDADGNKFAISTGSGHYVRVSYNSGAGDPPISPIITPNAAATSADLIAAGVPTAPQAGH